MTKLSAEIRQICNHIFRPWVGIVSLFFLLTTGVSAQTTSVTDGATPLAIAPGAPAGSYALSEFDSINLYNGSLNFRLPLLHIGGRGDAQYAMSLPIEQHWTVRHRVNQIDELHYPEFNWWNLLKPGYGPGVLVGRTVNDNRCDIFGQFGSTQSLTRLTFTAPNGTEYELRDKATNGNILLSTCPYYANGGPGASRGTVFATADGTAVTFISDTTIYDTNAFGSINNAGVFRVSGYLIFRNGVRYRIDGGLVSWIRDRNGNQLTFGYGRLGVTSITDSLNRRVTISYADYQTVFYDEITFHGYGGAPRAIRVNYSVLSSVLRSGSVQTYAQLFPELSGASTTTLFDFYVVSSVTLPDNRQYQFKYNSYGELARVVLPTGGSYEYDFGSGGGNLQDSGVVYEGTYGIYRRVYERRVYSDGSTLTGKTTYSKPQSVSGDVTSHQVYVIVDHLSSDGTTVLARETHYFYGNPIDSLFPPSAFSYARWKDGKEFQTEYGITTALRRVVQNWQQRAAVSWWTGDPDAAPQNDPRIVETVTTLVDANLVSKQAFGYDQYNNQTDVYEYDFSADAPGPLIRHTHTDYVTINNGVDYAGGLNIHTRNLPLRQQVFDADGTKRAEMLYEYDNYHPDAFHAALSDCLNISGHDGAFSTGYLTRGNLTKTSRSLLDNKGAATGSINSYAQYDIAGNVVKAIDANDNPTTLDFSDRFGSTGEDAEQNTPPAELNGQTAYAFATKVTNALNHTAYTKYDYYLGQPVNREDANGIISSVAYNDALDRPTQGIQARYKVTTPACAPPSICVPAEERQTTITYDDANHVITTTSDRDTFKDNILTGKSYYDGLGRMRRSATYEGSTWSIQDTQFDALSRVSQVSNPYRAADPTSALPPDDLWVTTEYDELSRVIEVTTPDDAHVITEYSGNQATVVDQAGKRRRSETDALERLTRVTEDPGNLNYETYYSYDALGNLNVVTQQAQIRTFAHDSLSRLISATNPESGQVTYAYDPNGNLIEKTDNRGVKTAMNYDALNRVKSKTYSGSTTEGSATANLTPPVNYFYDDYTGLPSGAPTWSGTPSKGRLIGVTYGTGSEGTYYKYDAAGRIVINHQRQGTSNYATNYAYNLASGLTREQRGNYVNNVWKDYFRNSWTYDKAGRLSGMQASLTPFLSSVPLVGDISYAPFGGVQSETYGNGLIHSIGYNSRPQPTEIRLGRPDNLESVFTIYYMYGIAQNVNDPDTDITPVHNNGDIARVRYSVSGTVQYAQTFQYDSLNRLSYAVEHNNGEYNDGARAWYQARDYDRYGNGGINVANTSDNVDASNTALQLADFSGVNNRITRAGYIYDAAGNLTAEPGKSYTYDGENRLVTATMTTGATSQYVYDGNGRRVKKIVGGVGTRFEYGAGGELIVERDDATGTVTKVYCYKGGELLATTTNGTSYEYATADHLGSPRAWTDGSGNLVAGGRHDYLPFGGELFAGVGTRATGQGYATSPQADGQRKQFDGYERDDETGLDYAQARYYANVQGRFTSPDPMLTSGRIENPQTWNRYNFTLNNPLKYTDPNGLYEWGDTLGGALSDDELDVLVKNGKKIGPESYKTYKKWQDGRKQFKRALDKLTMANVNSNGKLSDSVRAYGNEGEKNGVTIEQGKLPDNVGAQAEVTGLSYNRDGNLSAIDIVVTINEKARSDDILTIEVGHEGRHVADDQAAYGLWIITNKAFAANNPYNLTKYDRENGAYHVSAIIAEALGFSPLTYSGNTIWKKGMANVDQQALDRVLKEKPYKVTPSSANGQPGPGPRIIQ
jgi:RHS repeat-associated protein